MFLIMKSLVLSPDILDTGLHYTSKTAVFRGLNDKVLSSVAQGGVNGPFLSGYQFTSDK